MNSHIITKTRLSNQNQGKKSVLFQGLDFDGCKMSKNEKSAKNIAEGWKTKLDAQRKESSQLKQKDVNEKGLRRNASEDAAKETRVNEYLEWVETNP